MSSVLRIPASTECKFLLNLLTSLDRMMIFLPPEFGKAIAPPIVFAGSASVTQVVTMGLEASVAFIYFKVFGERIPIDPNEEEKSRINAIYMALGKTPLYE